VNLFIHLTNLKKNIMKKAIVLSALTVLLCLSFGLTKSFAGGCTATCTFSTCTVGGCAQWGCGCYWGLATCHCNGTSGGGGSTTVKKLNLNSVSDFNVYAMNSGSPGLASVAQILMSMNDSNYDSMFETYQTAVEGLSQADQDLFSVYLEL
jgi:hypothetical protein